MFMVLNKAYVEPEAQPNKRKHGPATLRRGVIIICEYSEGSSVWVNASAQAVHAGVSVWP